MGNPNEKRNGKPNAKSHGTTQRVPTQRSESAPLQPPPIAPRMDPPPSRHGDPEPLPPIPTARTPKLPQRPPRYGDSHAHLQPSLPTRGAQCPPPGGLLSVWGAGREGNRHGNRSTPTLRWPTDAPCAGSSVCAYSPAHSMANVGLRPPRFPPPRLPGEPGPPRGTASEPRGNRWARGPGRRGGWDGTGWGIRVG